METTHTTKLKPLPDLNLPSRDQVKIFIQIIAQNIETLGFEVGNEKISFFFSNRDNVLTIQLDILGKSRLSYTTRIVISKDNKGNYHAQLHAFYYEEENKKIKDFYLSDRVELAEFEKNFESIMNNLV